MKKFIKILPLLLILLIGFTERDLLLYGSAAGNWYQQYMPNLHGAQIKDITFTDSLTGYAITGLDSFSTAYILKTTNRGDNWFNSLTDNVGYTRLQFLNNTTGFVGRLFTPPGGNLIYKTTNGGANWFTMNTPSDDTPLDMFVLNEDTTWIAGGGSLNGILRTTNGGISWTHQFDGIGVYPTKVYMCNRNIGFMVFQGNILYRTTNSGQNWSPVTGGGYSDIYFIDSLTGWKANGNMMKTTDGGLNWVTQTLPSGGMIESSGIGSFSNINKDTIWGTGGYVRFPNNQLRRILFRTTNGGNNWYFQIPDTSFRGDFSYINFIDKLNGWVTSVYAGTYTDQIHTTTGGDTTFLIGIKQISNEVPKEFMLYQNYPNPFNPSTKIKYSVKRQTSDVKLAVYDIDGKIIAILVNQKQNAGTYQVDFSGNGFASGVYFYRIEINSGKEVYSETRKMILIK